MMDAPLVVLRRAQIGKAQGLDVTVKSARGVAQAFAPTWDMVTDYKQKRLSEEQYGCLYRESLERVPKSTWRLLYQAGLQNRGEVTLLCYCRDGWFCHTHLLIEYACRIWPKAFVAEVEAWTLHE